MACINPNDPEFKKILKQVGGNPLLAAIEFNELYPEEGEKTSIDTKSNIDRLKQFLPKTISINRPQEFADYGYTLKSTYAAEIGTILRSFADNKISDEEFSDRLLGVLEEQSFTSKERVDKMRVLELKSLALTIKYRDLILSNKENILKNVIKKQSSKKFELRKVNDREDSFVIDTDYGGAGIGFNPITNEVWENDNKSILNTKSGESLAAWGEVIKPGVSELFESNPELANAVYEALGIYNVWHASDKKIDKFISENVEGYFAKVKKGSPKAVFFTADKAPQESFLSKREYQEQFAVKMNNPLVVDTKTGYSRDNESFKELVDRALAGNHDGVIVKNVDDNGFVGDVYISLNANQISKITPQQKQQALQLYSQYLDTIFPDSKVKDIVYHRTNSDWFKRELFSKKIKPQTGIGEDNKIPEFQDAIYFYYKDKEGHSNVKGKYTFPVILNIKLLGEYTGKGRIFNIASDKKTLDDLENEISRLEKLIARSQDPSFIKEKREEEDKLLKIYNELYDNSKIKQIAQLEEGQGLTYIKKWDFSNIDGITDYRWVLVPSPEQIHILGSKQDIQGFKEFVDKSTFKQLELDPEMSNYIADQISKAFNVPIPGMEKDTLITAEEIENFNRDVENRDGRLPSEYFTGIDDVNKWVLNKSELYDLVDKDTGEIYLKDVNLSTGQVEKQDKPSQPVPDKERQEAIDYLNNAVKDFRIDEILAERGYDVNDIISNLASAENKEEFDKIINKLLRLLC